MSPASRLHVLIFFLIAAFVTIVVVALYSLHATAIQQAQTSLIGTARLKAATIGALRADADQTWRSLYAGASKTEPTRIRKVLERTGGFGQSGSFVVGWRTGSEVTILATSQTAARGVESRRVAATGPLAEPMKRALEGQTGSIIASDYRGVPVIAAYAPIDSAGLGVVAKVDLAEIRRPFYRAAVMLSFVLALVGLGTWVAIATMAAPMVDIIAQGESKLRDSEALVRVVVDSLPAVVSYVDRDLVYRMANLTYERWWRRSREDVCGLTVRDVLGDEGFSQAKPYIDRVLTGELVEYEATFACPDGQVRDSRVFYVPHVAESGQVEGFVVLGEDISRLRQTESQNRILSRAVEQSPDMVIITDADGSIEYVNPGFTKITGYSADDVVGASPALLRSEATPDSVYGEMWRNISSGVEWRGELLDKRRNGELFWVRATISPIRSSDGQITHFVAVEQDITESKQAQIDALRAKEQAELASRAKSEMLANMSHELRTPLNAIIGYSEAIVQGVFGDRLDGKNREYIADIHESGHHLLSLINDVLDVSAIEAGHVELREDEFDLGDAIDATFKMLAPRAQKGCVTLVRRVDKGPPRLLGDRRRVTQVLVNLMSNAVKFTPEGGRVSVWVESASDRGLRVVVADTGIGMDSAGLAKALTLFGQADSGLDRRYEGTGLGLPLAVGLMRLHGGDLIVDSVPGKGTTVAAQFPPERTVVGVEVPVDVPLLSAARA